MATTPEPLHIIKLEAENLKRLRAVRIEPDGSVVRITGRNSAGKSSVLDAIATAIGGKRLQADEPIRRGTKRATVKVDLGSRGEVKLHVERKITAKSQTLTVVDADGVLQEGPQAVLDALCSKLTFDPLAFMRKSDRDQAAELRMITGLDTSDLDAQRETLVEERKAAKRDKARIEARVSETPPPKVDGDIIDVESLQRTISAVENCNRGIERCDREIEMLETRLADTKDERDRWLAERERVGPASGDTRELAEQLAHAHEHNEAVRAREAYDESIVDLTAVRDEIEAATNEIEDIDRQRTERLAAAPMPVDGLTVDDDGVRFNGIPLKQCAWNEQLRVSAAVAMNLNPRLRVMMVRDGALLDSSSRALLEGLAAENNFQLWLEQATDGEPVGIVIADGEVEEGGAS